MKSLDKVSLIIKYPKGAPGNKLTKIGGLYFRIRLAGRKDYTQVATGLQASRAIFDLKKKEFNHRAPNAAEDNVKIKDQEADLLKKLMAGYAIKKERLKITPAQDNDVTFQYIVREYKRRAEAGLLKVKRTGLPLAEDSVATIVSVMNIAANSGVDFNFSMWNATTKDKGVRDQYNQFVTRLINTMSGLDLSTQSHRCTKIKQAIMVICKAKEILIGDLLDDLKVYAPDKAVETIDKDQVRYCINNYEEIQAESSETEARAFEYFVVALMTLARKKDMDLWQKDNLYMKDGKPWFRYKQHKTKNTSARIINIPLPDLCYRIFKKNLKLYGKLMAKWNCRMCQKLRDRAERMPIFANMVQIIGDDGKAKMVPQWRTLIIHMGRASGMSDKLSNGMDMAWVKEWSGHTPGSKAVDRYIKMQEENKEDVHAEYLETLVEKKDKKKVA